jgi:nitroreductase
MENTTTGAAGVGRALQERRAIKEFDPEHRISDTAFNRLMGHALLSPTAFNIQHWRYVRVVDPKLRRAIRAAAWDQPQITDASELLILCMDLKAWDKAPERYWRNAPQETRDSLIPLLSGFYRDRPQLQRDEGFRSCGLAAMAIMLMAKEMGYDSCPMVGFDFDRVAELINLPEDHAICMAIAIGKRTRDAWPRAGQLSLEEVLVTDRF